VLSDPAERRAYDTLHAFAGPGYYRRHRPAYEERRGQTVDERDAEWASAAYDEAAADSAEERLRRARESRASRARHVRPEEEAADDEAENERLRRERGDDGRVFDFEEWNRMHFGPTDEERAEAARRRVHEARRAGYNSFRAAAGGDGAGGAASGGKRAGAYTAAEASAMGAAAFAEAPYMDARERYRTFAREFRASRAVADRRFPWAMGALSVGLIAAYFVIKETDVLPARRPKSTPGPGWAP
jgi:hypothetical protein